MLLQSSQLNNKREHRKVREVFSILIFPEVDINFDTCTLMLS
jgi:hypothetical protein